MRFHVDIDLGSEISLWIAPDHPDRVPWISVWDGARRIATMEANILRDDVRQLGMHSTGQVGFAINADAVAEIERLSELKIVFEEDPEDTAGEGEAGAGEALVIYRRAGSLLNRRQRLLIIDTGMDRAGHGWEPILSHYAQPYPSLEKFNLETLMSILGNELAPSIGAVGFPYLGRIRGILDSLDYQIVMMFRDPMTELARQIDRWINVTSSEREAVPATLNRRALIAVLRDLSETETFELSNPVMRKLLKAPGEQVTSKDVTNGLRQMANLNLVATDATCDLIASRGGEVPVLLPSAPRLTSRQEQIANHLRQIGLATDIIAEDLTLYDMASAAIVRACEKPQAQSGLRDDS